MHVSLLHDLGQKQNVPNLVDSQKIYSTNTVETLLFN